MGNFMQDQIMKWNFAKPEGFTKRTTWTRALSFTQIQGNYIHMFFTCIHKHILYTAHCISYVVTCGYMHPCDIDTIWIDACRMLGNISVCRGKHRRLRRGHSRVPLVSCGWGIYLQAADLREGLDVPWQIEHMPWCRSWGCHQLVVATGHAVDLLVGGFIVVHNC